MATILSFYAQTGRVHNLLGRDLVFRRRWFDNTFLPSLLFEDPARLSPTLSKEAAAKARHGLVEELYKLGRIPPKLNAQYREGRKGGASGNTAAAVEIAKTAVPSSTIEASKKRKQSTEAVGPVGKKTGQDNKENISILESKSIERSLWKRSGDATASLVSHGHQLNEMTTRTAATLNPIYNLQKSSLTEQRDMQLRPVSIIPPAPHSVTASSHTLTNTYLPSPNPVVESIGVTDQSLRVDLPTRPITNLAVDEASASCVKKQLLQKLGGLRKSKAPNKLRAL